MDMKTTFLQKAYFRGAIVDFDKAQVSIATHALHYGTAAFGGMRVTPDPHQPGNVLLFRPELHAKRLSASARLLGYELSAEAILDALTQFVAANDGSAPYYLRPLVYVSDLGIAPRLHDVEHDFLIYGLPMGDYLPATGVRCCISSWMRNEDRTLPLRGKIAGSYVTSALAKTEAEARGYDEAILLNAAGKVAEASAMNVFVVRGSQLITPDVSQDILEGITRRSIIELAGAAGIEVVERPVDKSELLMADEVFLSGTAAQITPVKEIEQYTLPPQRPITERLQKSFKQAAAGEDPQFRDWTVSLPAATKKA